MADRAALIQRLSANGPHAWMGPGRVGVILGIDPKTVRAMTRRGELGHRPHPSQPRWIVIDPADVLTRLATPLDTHRAATPVGSDRPGNATIPPHRAGDQGITDPGNRVKR